MPANRRIVFAKSTECLPDPLRFIACYFEDAIFVVEKYKQVSILDQLRFSDLVRIEYDVVVGF